eukprot:scaffold1500_cov398-Prasinococcus_capsulatus_cf.AAC.22
MSDDEDFKLSEEEEEEEQDDGGSDFELEEEFRASRRRGGGGGRARSRASRVEQEHSDYEPEEEEDLDYKEGEDEEDRPKAKRKTDEADYWEADDDEIEYEEEEDELDLADRSMARASVHMAGPRSSRRGRAVDYSELRPNADIYEYDEEPEEVDEEEPAADAEDEEEFQGDEDSDASEDDDDGEFDNSDEEDDADDSDEEYGQASRRTVKRKMSKRGKRTKLLDSPDSHGEYKPERRSRKTSTAEPTRSSSRSKNQISYAELEGDSDSEDDEARKKKEQKAKALAAIRDPDLVLEDAADVVIAHRVPGDHPPGNKVPSVGDIPGDIASWEDVEFLIKWKGRSHLHNTWEPYFTLQPLPGFRKVVNYIKRFEESDTAKMNLSLEEIEAADVAREMELELVQSHTTVDRIIIASSDCPGRESRDSLEYLVKWKGLPYVESSWENVNDIDFAREEIELYDKRVAAYGDAGYSVKQARERYIHENFDVETRKFNQITEQPGYLIGGTLRDYQLESLNWMTFNWAQDQNGILADEMGLGKTIQCIAFLSYLHGTLEQKGPFICVVPLSVVPNWVKEFRKWAPDLNVIVYVGDSNSRELIRQYEFYTPGSKRKYKFNVLLTTYEIVRMDVAFMTQVKWNFLMVDEAHCLKNYDSTLYHTLQDLQARNRLLVTGTPLQNNLKEFWSLLHFLHPLKFDDLKDFETKFDSQDPETVEALQKTLQPYLLRRKVKDVERSLPPKTERLLRVEMSPMQKEIYRMILERNVHELNKGVKGSKQTSLLNIVVELKKCCNHPFLFESFNETYGQTLLGDSVVDNYISVCGKMRLLDQLLGRLKRDGHRVLIFSQMVRMLNIISEYLKLRGYQHQRLDGSTKGDTRQQAMDHFNAPDSTDFCFLLSTRAGGLGINLYTANTVIIFDSDWNPQNDLQAMARAHRIGQKDSVNVYRLVTSNSVEEDILERAKRKMVLDQVVIQHMDTSGRTVMNVKSDKSAAKDFKKEDLQAILRFGAEELFKNKDQEEHQADDLDLDAILERAEQVHQQEEAGEAADFMKGFQVVNYQIEEDDGTFWKKLIPVAKGVDEELGAVAPRAAALTAYNRMQQINSAGYVEEKSAVSLARRAPQRKAPAGPRGRTANVGNKGARGRSLGSTLVSVNEWKGSASELTSEEAIAFAKGVEKYGDRGQVQRIAEEVGGALLSASEEELQGLYDSLIDACEEANAIARQHDDQRRAEVAKKVKEDEEEADENDTETPAKLKKFQPSSPTVNFFGAIVYSKTLVPRAQELTELSEQIRKFNRPTMFRCESRMVMQPRWSRKVGWTPADDAMLLVGIFLHGYGEWKAIREDHTLKLSSKIGDPLKDGYPDFKTIDSRAQLLLKKLVESRGKDSKGTAKPAKQATRSGSRGKRQSSRARSGPKGEPASDDDFDSDDEEANGTITIDPKKVLRPECLTVLKKIQQLQKATHLTNETIKRKMMKYVVQAGDMIEDTIQKVVRSPISLSAATSASI